VLTDIPYNEVDRPSNGLRNLDKGSADILTFDLEKFLIEIDRVCSATNLLNSAVQGETSRVREADRHTPGTPPIHGETTMGTSKSDSVTVHPHTRGKHSLVGVAGPA